MRLWLAIIFVIVSWTDGGPSQGSAEVNVIEARKSLYRNIYSKYEGDIYLAAMFSIRHTNGVHGCGRIIDQDGLQVITAAAYGIEMVKNTTNLPLRIGFLAIDTCQDPDHGLEQSKDFMLFKSCDTSSTYTCPDKSSPRVKEEYRNLQRIFGIFGAGNSDVSIMAATFLRLVDLPQVSYFSTSPDLSESLKYPGFFRTIPSDLYTVKAIAQLIRQYNWNFILIVHDNSKYSISTKDSFQSFVTRSNNDNNNICISESVVIRQEWSYTNLSSVIEQIRDKTSGLQRPKVVLTFLTQAVVEELLKYIEQNPVEEFNNVVWIGTDSWGGRQWPNVTKDNPLMNNSISIIPRSTKMTDFMDYYKKRLPAIDDYNPWLARKFERICKCQYTNDSLFIFPELQKLRKQKNNIRACEPLESSCSIDVYKESLQMPYIHYVMDGILAYGHIIQTLIGDACQGLNHSACSDLIWKNVTILNYTNMIAELKKVEFTDSTNETFTFWKQRDGIPAYSVLYFNKSAQIWDIVGSFNDYNETSREFKIVIKDYFDMHLRQNNYIAPCSQPCVLGSRRKYLGNPCCWNCHECTRHQIVNKSPPGSDDKCQDCPNGTTPSPDRSKCDKVKPTLMSLGELGALIIFFADLFGLLYCGFTFVIMITYWKTPIIKAFGKETSSIILFGTVLSFALSMSLLGEPSRIRCCLYWFSPGFCSTICYASILAKTNRIVRIFSLNWSSKTKSTPKFVSPMSQISIIGFITLLQACIIIIIIIVKDVSSFEETSQSKISIQCTKMDAGNLVATFLIPILLLLASTFYAFKMRKTPDGFNETRNINFMNFANCVVLVTSLFLYQLLSSIDSVYPLCLQMTLSAYGNLIGLFTPKLYLVLCRPEKNTLESVTARSRTKSQVSFSQPNTPMSDINLLSNPGNVRCRKCNTLIDGHDSNSEGSSVPTNKGIKSHTKVFFVEDHSGPMRSNSRDIIINETIGERNQAYDEEF